MPHHSNGRHRMHATNVSSRVADDRLHQSNWMSSMEAGIANTHDVLVEKATHFIREKPGTSLVIAAVVGGLVGWLIKRRK